MSEQAITASRAFQCIRARARDSDTAERALAEAVEAGASGAEQRDEEGALILLLYATREAIPAVAAAARSVLGEGAVDEAADLDAVDWSEAWKQGLEAVEISPRLRVRPPFDTSSPRPGQLDLVIEPGQAFGTGGHESTRLALAWLDALGEERRGARLLDAGVGSGVLSLAALALGARSALGFDLDPLAPLAARDNARRNGLEAGLQLFCGPVESLRRDARFDGIVANLLRRELEPLLPALSERLQSGGWIVIAGLVREELERVTAAAAALGLHLEGQRSAVDASGTEWVAALMRSGPPRAGH